MLVKFNERRISLRCTSYSELVKKEGKIKKQMQAELNGKYRLRKQYR